MRSTPKVDSLPTRRRSRRSPEQPRIHFGSPEGHYGQPALVEAERVLLEVADYVYGHTSLKPISKTLFFLSRCLCVAKLSGETLTAGELARKYRSIRASLNGSAPDDDFDFSAVVAECREHVPRVLEAVHAVLRLTEKTDCLGLVFNTLLRGKFEGGEGLGTYLTPEEVVAPMVDMLLKTVDEPLVERLGDKRSLLYGDVCGGTGRFVYAIARRLESRGVSRRRLEKAARLFDQSRMAVDLGKLNFLFEGMRPAFECVGDSLAAPQVSALKSRFLLLATNPPFGAGKYRWNEAIAQTVPLEVLASVGMTGRGDAADPSTLFFFRNLDLLAAGGALAIVMPDGVVQSLGFKQALAVYEQVRSTSLHVAAIVSLPSVTFALGGTVAKTSFVIVQKQKKAARKPLYVAVARHVGFVKRAKTRADDPQGNDLITIAEEFGNEQPALGHAVESWRAHESLAPARLLHVKGARGPRTASSPAGRRLCDLVAMVRDYQGAGDDDCPEKFHVSVLDVDATGLLDIVAAEKNQPMSKGLTCRAGDILVSCMNPRIWRVAVVPKLAGAWSCSPEFAVLRPKQAADAWKLALALHHPSVVQTVQSMAKGTSSSRQRVPKDRLLAVFVPELIIGKTLADYIAWREEFYRKRLREARQYEAVHGGECEFSW